MSQCELQALLSLNFSLYLQREGELEVGLRQSCGGQQDLVGAQDPLGALWRQHKRGEADCEHKTGALQDRAKEITRSVSWLNPAMNYQSQRKRRKEREGKEPTEIGDRRWWERTESSFKSFMCQMIIH